MSEEPESKRSAKLETVGSITTMNLHNVLYQNILTSAYFKGLYEIKTFHEVVDEIYNREPFFGGNHASTAFCLLYKLWTLKLTENQVEELITHTDSPHIRALGFLYLRYAGKPADLWSWFEPYLDDEEDLSVEAGQKPRSITIGRFLNDLLTENKWLGTILPRPLLLLTNSTTNPCMTLLAVELLGKMTTVLLASPHMPPATIAMGHVATADLVAHTATIKTIGDRRGHTRRDVETVSRIAAAAGALTAVTTKEEVAIAVRIMDDGAGIGSDLRARFWTMGATMPPTGETFQDLEEAAGTTFIVADPVSRCAFWTLF
ncbi:PRP38 pre-mRNA processing factor 38 domain-containing protein B [Thoreauomyces humboldtii]|nr:PRP38 pre-mRNA processing factor 38 domain-containing protein B [Thoreauomyces humboldtii]